MYARGQGGGSYRPGCEKSALSMSWRLACQRAALTHTGSKVYIQDGSTLCNVAPYSNLVGYRGSNLVLRVAMCFYS